MSFLKYKRAAQMDCLLGAPMDGSAPLVTRTRVRTYMLVLNDVMPIPRLLVHAEPTIVEV